MKIKYMKHPVSYEDKKMANMNGYRIVDEKYAPEGYKKPGRKKKVEVE